MFIIKQFEFKIYKYIIDKTIIQKIKFCGKHNSEKGMSQQKNSSKFWLQRAFLMNYCTFLTV